MVITCGSQTQTIPTLLAVDADARELSRRSTIYHLPRHKGSYPFNKCCYNKAIRLLTHSLPSGNAEWRSRGESEAKRWEKKRWESEMQEAQLASERVQKLPDVIRRSELYGVIGGHVEVELEQNQRRQATTTTTWCQRCQRCQWCQPSSSCGPHHRGPVTPASGCPAITSHGCQ